ncbi:hypothetical protein BC829DRAFT_400177 [Chytridium lagenaria]|nr:hypothetical protein BC829DRAFT_400177 [Chytridium lagenaria]
MMASSATEDQRVVLNTLHSTLLNIPDSLLGLIAILDGYRSNGDLICPPTVAERTFQQELDFWQIPRDDIQDSSSSIHSTSPSNLLSPSDRKTLERTLMIMDSAQSMGLNNIEFLPSLCVGNSQKLWWSEIGVIVASVLEGDAQTREDGDRRVDVFEQALRERTGLGKTLTVRRPAVVPPSTAMEDELTLLHLRHLSNLLTFPHWECNLVVP